MDCVRCLTALLLVFPFGIALFEAFPAQAKISANHQPGAVIIGPQADTCTNSIYGALSYSGISTDTWCYCNGTSWKPVANAPATNGLLAYWKLDETSGTSAADSTGNGNTGTTHGNPSWVSGYINNAISLNGSTEYISVPNSATYLQPTDFTIAAWVKLNSTSGWQSVIAKTVGSATNKSYELFINGGVLGVGLATSGAGGAATDYNTSVTLSSGKWYHLAATMLGTVLTIWVNGEAVYQSAAITIGYDTNSVYIGTGFNSGSSATPLNGLIDDVRIYNRALSAYEIGGLYAYTAACGG